VAGQPPRVIDETTTIARERHPLRHRVEITEWIDTIAARHWPTVVVTAGRILHSVEICIEC
jgi:hypothetical protein